MTSAAAEATSRLWTSTLPHLPLAGLLRYQPAEGAAAEIAFSLYLPPAARYRNPPGALPSALGFKSLNFQKAWPPKGSHAFWCGRRDLNHPCILYYQSFAVPYMILT